MTKPINLSDEGNKAYDIIMSFLKEHDLMGSGGYDIFRSPSDWKDRGEEYGIGSELIIIHDGGDHAYAFSWDYENYELIEALNAKLKEVGLYSEQCTTWYSAIYKD